MSARFAAISEQELDRLRELAHIGACWSANALSRLADRTILTRVPVVYGPERLARRSDWETGVFCTIDGDAAGVIAIFLSAASRQAIVELLCGTPDPPKEISASALSEFGNILVSQTASAIANTLGGRVIPSLPELVLTDAEAAFQMTMTARGRLVPPVYIESELFDRGGQLRALHVVLPQIDKFSEVID